MKFAPCTLSLAGLVGGWSTCTPTPCVCRTFRPSFPSATGLVKQDKGKGSMLVPGSTPTLPSHRSCHGGFWFVRLENAGVWLG